MSRRKRPTETLDPHLLRERAKNHISKREWERALACLDTILREPLDLPAGEPFIPNKQSLVIRGRVKLILCQNDAALADAHAALSGLTTADPVFPKALMLLADTLYQMGKFEHALVQYHRGNRVKDSDDFRLGIQKGTESIQNCLKNTKRKMKVDVRVDDTTRMADRQTVIRTSFVFPKDNVGTATGAAKTARKQSHHRKLSRMESSADSIDSGAGNTMKFCTVTSKPFQRDIFELKRIVNCLSSSKSSHLDPKLSQKVASLTSDTLTYVTERNVLWEKQDVKTDGAEEKQGCNFDIDHLP